MFLSHTTYIPRAQGRHNLTPQLSYLVLRANAARVCAGAPDCPAHFYLHHLMLCVPGGRERPLGSSDAWLLAQCLAHGSE